MTETIACPDDLVDRIEKVTGRKLDDAERKIVAYMASQAEKQATCAHAGWKGLAASGRLCLDCGAQIIDFGD